MEPFSCDGTGVQKTVLIVEDDEPTQALLEALMQRDGLATVTARNGKAAIEILGARDDIAVMILDLMMPEVDGYAVLDHVAQTGKSIAVIVCTAAVGSKMPPLDDRIVRAVVRKPFDIEQLTAIVTALIR